MRILSLMIITFCLLFSLNIKAANTDSDMLQLAATGPGTQTEDELFIGARAKNDAKKSVKQQDRQTKKPEKTKKAAKPRKTGDEDLDDLEIQRNRARER